MRKLDYEGLSNLAREKARVEAVQCFPPEQKDLIAKKQDELYWIYYRQYITPPRVF